jgi:3-hydroxyethyl bacteriochlorophyllide a dehydrogenase
MERALAVVFTAPNEVVMEEVEISDPGDHEVLIRSEWSMVSNGTEKWMFEGNFYWMDTPYPCVPGYQRVGIIEKLGQKVEGYQIGQRVFATSSTWAGHIRPHLGTHIALANTPSSEVYVLSEAIDPFEVAGAVVVQVGWNAASRLDIQTGDWVAVLGDGIIGQYAAQSVQARGGRAILIGRRAERLRIAITCGIHTTLNLREKDVTSDDILSITMGVGISGVIDTIQTLESQKLYMDWPLAAERLVVVYSGHTPSSNWADMGWHQRKETTCHYVSGWTRARMEQTLEMIAAGRLQTRPLITSIFQSDHAHEAYRLLADGAKDQLGLMLKWSEY